MAVADCIENALQIKLVSRLVNLAGVGRRNHFFKNRFLSHSLYYERAMYYFVGLSSTNKYLASKH
ncbi:hypothetical protein [Staphylococcus arlettae]|uniref:hypothetical protein n=1 Tax=Staphylococcus arlettae TaxID=29378 RepID=UPI0010572522|nr:hypothetical protein [Staphylococcus arlettae]